MVRTTKTTAHTFRVWSSKSSHVFMQIDFAPLVSSLLYNFKEELKSSENTVLIHWNPIYKMWGLYSVTTDTYEILDWDKLSYGGSLSCAVEVPKSYESHRPTAVIAVFNYVSY